MGEIRVLVLGDEVTFLMAIRRILDGPELIVETAENFNDAITLINEQDFNFVITDLRLTDAINTEGLDILRHIRQRRPGKSHNPYRVRQYRDHGKSLFHGS